MYKNGKEDKTICPTGGYQATISSNKSNNNHMLSIEIIGNLGADAEVKPIKGKDYIVFTVAHTEKYTDAAGNKQEFTTWVNCYKSHKTDSSLLSYLKKGTKVYIRGGLSVGTYETKSGVKAGINCNIKELQLISPAKTSQPANTTTPEQPQNKYNDDLPF